MIQNPLTADLDSGFGFAVGALLCSVRPYFRAQVRRLLKFSVRAQTRSLNNRPSRVVPQTPYLECSVFALKSGSLQSSTQGPHVDNVDPVDSHEKEKLTTGLARTRGPAAQAHLNFFAGPCGEHLPASGELQLAKPCFPRFILP